MAQPAARPRAPKARVGATARRVAAASAALGALLLAGCLSTPHQQTVPLASDFIESPSQQNHAVRFMPYDTTLSEAERVRLVGFVLQVRPDRDDWVAVTGGGSLADIRVAEVASALAAEGVFVGERRPEYNGLPTVTVTVMREAMIPVRCQPGPVPLTDPYRVVSPPGCANDLALARMVADPSDLTRGRTTGPADGPGRVLGIGRYRGDAIRPLVVYGTSEAGG